MNLLNPYAFTPLGSPVAPGVSTLRSIGAQASAAQLDQARRVFGAFCAQSRLSMAPNQTAIGQLPDGSRYKITVVGAQTIMSVWPINAARNPPALLTSGIWFCVDKLSTMTGLENRSRIYTAKSPATGKLLVNQKKQGGGSSSVWELAPFSYPFFGPIENSYQPTIPLTGGAGWVYTYDMDMGQFGRTASISQLAGSDVRVTPMAVIGRDAVELFVDVEIGATSYYAGVNSRLWAGAFNYAVPQDSSTASTLLPGSFMTPTESRVYTFSDPDSLDNAPVTHRSSIDHKYIAFPLIRKTVVGDEVLDYRSPGNTLDYMLLNMVGAVARVAYVFTSNTTALIFTSPSMFDIEGSDDGLKRKLTPEVHVFRVAEGGCVLDHIEHYTPETAEVFTPALSRQKSLFTGKYALNSYTREVVRYTYPSSIGGPPIGPIDIAVRADYSGEYPEFIGVNASGVGQYVRITEDTAYSSDIAGSIAEGGLITGNSTGSYSHDASTNVFGVNLVTAANAVNAANSYSPGITQISYTSSSETRHILYTVPEIELLVYQHQKGTYTHSSSKTWDSVEEVIVATQATNEPVMEIRRIVIQCKGTQLFIDAPPTVLAEDDPDRNVSGYHALGLFAAIGGINVSGFSISMPGWGSTAFGDSDPIYPGAQGTLLSLGGSQYSTNAGGFVCIPGLQAFSMTVSHCFVPETGGVCLHISIPPMSASTARQTYYFLYDDESGLREMPTDMQTTILGSLQLPSGTLPPQDHMGQI